MDQNKLARLREIGYAVEACCALCQHGQFNPALNFGTCSKFAYDHLKHTGPARQLSVNRYGSCSKFLLDEDRTTAILQSFKQFL